MAELTFEPPGPGAWTLDDVHFSGPVSRYYRDVGPSAQLEGYREAAEHYGFLYEREIELVDGFLYHRFRPVVGTPAARPWADVRFRRRVDRLADTYDTKRWREDLERWDDEWKPAHRDTNRSLRAVEPAGLDDDLLGHLDRCRQALVDGEVLQHRMSFCWGYPQYDFLQYTSTWTGRSPDEVLSLLDGASPDSAGPVEERRRVVDAIQDTPAVREVVRSDADPAAIIDELRGADGAVGRAVSDWLDLVGYRPVSGWDLTEPYTLEHPETLVRSLRSALDEGSDGPVDHDPGDRLATIRREVPAEHRDRFDELHEEARLTYRVRDERNFLTAPSRGLLRRALLEVGRRLAERNRLRAPDHAVDLTHGEVVDIFDGAATPTAEEVAERVEYRRTHDSTAAPDRLGTDTANPYEDRDLPDPARRLIDGVRAYGRANDPDTAPESAAGPTIRGVSASGGTAEGTARVVSGPADVRAVRDGDVLVTDQLSPGFNVLLALIEGVVTDTGGKLSHPAIVAREYGLPAVVGCGDATDRIDDGDRVVVDGDAGTVRVL